jgi:predicted deacylase
MTRRRRTWLAALLVALASRAAAQVEDAVPTPAGAAPPAGESAETPTAPPAFEIFGVSVPVGQRRQLDWLVSESFVGQALPIPIQVIHGSAPGRTLCLTAGIHGDELNGVEIVRRAAAAIPAGDLRGTVIAAPIVNLHGFQRNSRYMPDRRDLNRFFPGRPSGSSASRIAHSFFGAVISRCDALVDFHTGSFHRTNLPHVRADLQRPDVAELALAFGEEIVMHGVGAAGTLRRAATDAGIPAIAYEVGEPMQLREEDIARGAERIETLLGRLGMLPEQEELLRMPEVYVRSRWVRVEDGGIMLAQVEIGDRVRTGDVLATVTNPISSHIRVLRSPHTGRVIGRAVNQVVIPGFAAFHIGLALPPETPPEAATADPEEPIEEAPTPEAEERPE